MLTNKFEDCIAESQFFIAQRLFSIWKQLGCVDFPEDKGVRFRNTVFAFFHGFVSELRGEGPGHDDFNSVNLPLLQDLKMHQLVRVVGILHFYAISWDFVLGKISSKMFSISLDWVFNTHGLPASASVEWHNLAMKRRKEIPAGAENYTAADTTTA